MCVWLPYYKPKNAAATATATAMQMRNVHQNTAMHSHRDDFTSCEMRQQHTMKTNTMYQRIIIMNENEINRRVNDLWTRFSVFIS